LNFFIFSERICQKHGGWGRSSIHGLSFFCGWGNDQGKFLDYLTKGEIIYGDQIGFVPGTLFITGKRSTSKPEILTAYPQTPLLENGETYLP
jgi:hypothetical protein